MKIVTIYKTSRGVFSTLEEAMIKKNRQKIDDYYSPLRGERETPEGITALYEEGRYYTLNEIEVEGYSHV